MHSTPEGTSGGRRRVPRAWLFLAAVFVVYIGLRLVQGVVWVIHHV